MVKERTPNRIIKAYVTSPEAPVDWQHRQTVQFLYSVFDAARFHFFSPRDERQIALPQSVIAVDELRHDTLAAYRISYNPNGLPFEIIMNSKWLNRPRWEICESVVHETVHLYQEYMADQNVPGMERCKRGYHNKQFVELAEDIGLHPLLGVGSHWKPADGQFACLMQRLGVERPVHASGTFSKPDGGVKGKPSWWDSDRGKSQGRSTLVLYTADACARTPVCKLRTGRKDLSLGCMECGASFRLRPRSTKNCKHACLQACSKSSRIWAHASPACSERPALICHLNISSG